MAITCEQVWEAAESLSTRGDKVTLDAVRTCLGGSGSYGTIQKHLRAWQAKRRAAADAPPPDVPEALAQHVANFGVEVWRQAMAEIGRRVEAERNAMNQVRDTMEREIQEATTIADRLNADLEEARADIVRLEAAATDATNRMAAMERELAAEAATRHQLEVQAVQREQAFMALQGQARDDLARVAGLDGRLQELEKQNDALLERVGAPSRRGAAS